MAGKLAGKHAEQAELAGRVAECQAKLEAKVQQLRAVADAKQQVSWLTAQPFMLCWCSISTCSSTSRAAMFCAKCMCPNAKNFMA